MSGEAGRTGFTTNGPIIIGIIINSNTANTSERMKKKMVIFGMFRSFLWVGFYMDILELPVFDSHVNYSRIVARSRS